MRRTGPVSACIANTHFSPRSLTGLTLEFHQSSESALRAALAHLQRAYNGTAQYLEHFGMTEQELFHLREALLEPEPF